MKAAELSCQSEKLLNGMRLQLIKTEAGVENLLGIFFSKFTVDKEFCTTINLRSADIQKSFKARCMEGRQRCVLPEEAMTFILDQLQKGESVLLHTKRQFVRLEPAEFKKLHKKLKKK